MFASSPQAAAAGPERDPLAGGGARRRRGWRSVGYVLYTLDIYQVPQGGSHHHHRAATGYAGYRGSASLRIQSPQPHPRRPYPRLRLHPPLAAQGRQRTFCLLYPLSRLPTLCTDSPALPPTRRQAGLLTGELAQSIARSAAR